MRTTPTLHRELVTKHNTYALDGRYGRVSCRKTCGRFRVRLERYDPANVTYADFATIQGALIYIEGAKEGLI